MREYFLSYWYVVINNFCVTAVCTVTHGYSDDGTLCGLEWGIQTTQGAWGGAPRVNPWGAVEKVLHTFSMMKVLRTFPWSFLYDYVTVVTSVQPTRSEFTRSQTLTAKLKLSNHKKKFLKASLTLRLIKGSPKTQRGIWSTYNLLITVGLYTQWLYL